MTALLTGVTSVVAALLVAAAGPLGQATPLEPSLRTTIGELGSFDFTTRSGAARDVRRADPDVAVSALGLAVRSHPD